MKTSIDKEQQETEDISTQNNSMSLEDKDPSTLATQDWLQKLGSSEELLADEKWKQQIDESQGNTDLAKWATAIDTGNLEKAKKNLTGVPDDMLQKYEQKSGLDLSAVRVYFNSPKPAEIGTFAYAEGTNIYIAPGQEKHLEHELAHVVQQLQGEVGVTETINNLDINSSSELEDDADKKVKETTDITGGLKEKKVSKPVIQGKWRHSDVYAKALLLNHELPIKNEEDWEQIKFAFDAYENTDEGPEETLSSLAKINDWVTTFKNDDLVQGNGLVARFGELQAGIAAERDLVKYEAQKIATGNAFKDGKAPRYMNITPTAGSKEGLSKPDTMTELPLDKQYRLDLPKDASTGIDLGHIDGAAEGRVIDVLAISGGHGGDGKLFETDVPGSFYEKDWWKAQMEALASKNIKAKYIILDACLTASMVDAFKPLLAPGGKIVGFLISIPTSITYPDFWKTVAEADPDTLETVINERIKEVMAIHTDLTKNSLNLEDQGISIGASAAVYSEDKGLRFDSSALSDDLETGLRSAGKEKAADELKDMRLTLRKDNEVTNYEPTLGQESGDVVEKVDTVDKSLADLTGDADWMKDDFSSRITADTAPELGDSIVYKMREYWEVKEVPSADNGQVYKLEKQD